MLSITNIDGFLGVPWQFLYALHSQVELSSSYSLSKWEVRISLLQYLHDLKHSFLAKVISILFVHSCFTIRRWKPGFAFLIPMSMSETFVFMLALLKGYRTLRERTFGLLSVLVKGSILFFWWCVFSYLMPKPMIRDFNQELHIVPIYNVYLDIQICAYLVV